MKDSVAGIFLGTMLGCYMYFYLTRIAFLHLEMVVAYGAIMEGMSIQGLDNLSIAMEFHFSILWV